MSDAARPPEILGTSGGVPVTEELIERLAAEAERGYAPERLAIRAPARSSGSSARADATFRAISPLTGTVDACHGVPEERGTRGAR